MSTSMKSTTLGFILIILFINKFNECNADNFDYDPIIDTTIRTSALNFFFLPPPYGAIFGSIAMIGAEAYIHLKHQTSTSAHSLNSQPLINTVNDLKELTILNSQNDKSSIEYILNNVLITKDLSETFAFLDDCYQGMCLNCFVEKNTCPSMSYNAIKKNLLEETSDYRVKLHGLVHNFVALNKLPIADDEPLHRIFELIVHNYKNRVIDGRDCGKYKSEHTKIMNIFFRVLGLLEKSYSFVLLASIDEYNINIENNNTKEAAHRLNSTIKIINNLYDDATRIIREVKWALKETSGDIRPCDAREPQRGKTWERLTNFVQAQLFGYKESMMGWMNVQACATSSNTPSQRLKKIQKQHPTSFNCNTTFYKTMNYKYTNPNDTERLIHHFGDYHDRNKYGPVESDDNLIKKYNEEYLCEPILCYIDDITNNHTVRSFDLNPVMAQKNNYVTGVRWSIINKTVTLEIQEGKYNGNKIVSSMWSRNLTSFKNVAILTAQEKSFSLDDVILPPTYYVTGVGFAKNKYQQIVLNVYGKRKSDNTSILFNSDIKNKRTKIQLANAKPSDNVSHYVQHKVLSKPINKYIVDFEPTSLEDDAGQTTVPYLDIQEVITKPPTMIGGVGTYYKGVEGFGGYIGLKLISPDVAYQIPDASDPELYYNIQTKLDTIASTLMKNNNSQELLESLSNALIIN